MSTVTLDQLTESKIEGTGVFDKLMKAVEAHIDQEFAKNRIKGPEYATVYLGALQSTLDQSIKFLLNKDDAAIKAKQLELMDKQIEELTARIALVNAQAANELINGANMEKQGLKLDAETALIGQQELKSVAETALLEQKKATELAQIDGTGVLEGSVLGRQMVLYKNQADGFVRDAEQKATRIMTETFSVRHSMDSSGTPANPDNRLQDKYIGSAIQQLLNGVGVDVTTIDSAP